jgi:hypothetical protein
MIVNNKTRVRKVVETPFHKICPCCLKEMSFSTEKKMKKITYCSVSCSSKTTMNNKEIREKKRNTLKTLNWSEHMKNIHRMNPHIKEMASQRMKLNNPMSNPETIEKMRLKLIGRTFLSRGGNGKLTEPQLILSKLLGDEWELELPILTNSVKEKFKSLPPSYRVDIGHRILKISIEIDGRTHEQKKWKFLDKRKTEVLNSLGWRVLRFWNKEVMTNPEICLQKIQEFMI